MGAYAQFCPVAKAAEVFDQRWTLLVLRELVAGSTRFDDLHRGLPRRSRTLLSRRLTQLERKGIVGRRETPEGPVYEFTGAGRELLPVLVAIGERGGALDEFPRRGGSGPGLPALGRAPPDRPRGAAPGLHGRRPGLR